MNSTNDAVDQSLSGLGFSGFDDRQTNQFNSQINIGIQHCKDSFSSLPSSSGSSLSTGSLSNDCTFFDADQLMKFANTTQADLDLEPKMKKFSDDFNQLVNFDCGNFEKCSIEETFLSSFKKNLSESPDNSCALSSSSDSGCRSTSSIAEEDSGIASLQTSKTASLVKVNALTCENLKTLNVLENSKLKQKLDDDLSDDDDDCVSNSDTSDDASEIPTDSEGLTDLDILDDLEVDSACNECVEPKKFNQTIEKDGSLVRKKLDYGIYRSINHTFSLFIEPQDILKKLDSDEYDEYVLFPNGIDTIESYFIIKNNRLVA